MDTGARTSVSASSLGRDGADKNVRAPTAVAWGPVCFSDPDQPGCSIYVFDPKVLEHPALRQQTHTRNQIQSLQNFAELKRWLKLTLWFLGGFALVALVASLLVGVMVRSLVARIPVQWEQELGDELVQDLKLRATFVEDPKLQARLERTVAPLLVVLPGTELQYKFYILQEPLPNAFALPGGHVFVTTSLLDLADRREEIAGVVAHEIAHVTLKHGFRKLISAAGPYLIFRFFVHDRSGFLGLLGHTPKCWSAKASPRNTNWRPTPPAGNTSWPRALTRAA